MSQPETSNNQGWNTGTKPDETPQPERNGTRKRSAGIIALALVAILALGFAGYTALSPHLTTVTQQQLVTNTESVYSTQMQTVTSVSPVTQVVTVSNTQAGNGFGLAPGSSEYCSAYGCMYPPGPSYNTYNPYNPPNPWSPGYYNGVYYGYWNGNFVQPCNTIGLSNNVTCSGYIFQSQNGCTVLVIPIANPYYSETYVYQYYSLRNLPSNIPANGSWVIMSGQLYQGPNTSSAGASCPGNYINVATIS